MKTRGLFVGLVTLDLIYLADDVPQRNQKVVALDYAVAAGGPATNAAVTYRYLGSPATVVGVVGCHPLAQLITADLQRWQVAIADLDPSQPAPPPTSSILVTQATGERTVISLNAQRSQATAEQWQQWQQWRQTGHPGQTEHSAPETLWDDVAVVLIDGHQLAVGLAIAQQARARGIPVVLDGGSWKTGLENLLPWVDYALCSADFEPPGCTNLVQRLAYLHHIGIDYCAITGGDQPIRYSYRDRNRPTDDYCTGEVSVPVIQPVDTLGAGDILHGAFCHWIGQHPWTVALEQAAAVASFSCQHFGTRTWMDAAADTGVLPFDRLRSPDERIL